MSKEKTNLTLSTEDKTKGREIAKELFGSSNLSKLFGYFINNYEDRKLISALKENNDVIQTMLEYNIGRGRLLGRAFLLDVFNRNKEIINNYEKK